MVGRLSILGVLMPVMSVIMFPLPLAFGLSDDASKDTLNFLKVRCSLDEEKDTFMTWRGEIYAYLPQTSPAHVFSFIGYNVARCQKQPDGNYRLLTRELSYYLDPKSKERLGSWTNPWTSETVNVMHVANNPVNSDVGPLPTEHVSQTEGIMSLDVPLFYPNPLHANESFAEYGGSAAFYEAGEFFKFYFHLDDLETAGDDVEDVSISWNRIGPYLPWMKMKNIDGYVLYSCTGAKAKDLSAMPQWLQVDVSSRLPLYLHAPLEFVEPNETSQGNFIKYFDRFLDGEEFPLPVAGTFEK